MAKSPAKHPHPITFLDAHEFLGHDASHGRVTRVLEGDVTLSASPDGAAGTRWEARTKDGQALPMFRLTVKPDTPVPDPSAPVATAARGPVVIDAMEGVYVCYEDEARQQSWCVKVK